MSRRSGAVPSSLLALPLVVLSMNALNGCRQVCNGHQELCDRPYDQVSFPGTHNAFSDIDEGFQSPDQTYDIARQLSDGIRVLHLELYPYQNDTYLCHGFCAFGAMRFADELANIETFVAAHPDEVVTLLLESTNVTSDAIANAFKASRLDDFVLPQSPAATWPTLAELLERDQRAVVFESDLTNTGGSSYAWLLPRFSLTWETPWNNQTLAEFGDCHADRGSSGNPIYVVDTYLEDLVIETLADSERVNYNPFLIDRLLDCQTQATKRPNFVMVDFYQASDVFADVEMLNGFIAAPRFDAASFPPAQ